ncbi:MAG: hypothetical protein ACOWWR_09060 [Eubacteriales bacterium]
MKKNEIEYDLPDYMNQEALNTLVRGLENYTVKMPDEVQIDYTINHLRQYVPSKGTKFTGIYTRIRSLLEHALMETSFMNRGYWIISLMLFIIGYVVTIMNTDIHPYYVIIALGPFPFILGLIEVFRGREEGMTEIEMSCKYSASEIMLSRIFVITLYDIFLNTVLSLLFKLSVFYVDLPTMTLCWFIPLAMISGLSLWASMKIKSQYTSMAFMLAWGSVILYSIVSERLMNMLLTLNPLVYQLIIFVGIFIAIVQVKKIANKYLAFEGSVRVEINN